MIYPTFKLRNITLALALVTPCVAQATNGMFMIGHGTKIQSMGGVSVGGTVDALSGAQNPATIAVFDQLQADVSMDIFMPNAFGTLEYDVSNAQPIALKSQADMFAMPAMAGAMKFKKKIYVGFSAVPAGGGGTRYDTNIYNYINNPEDPNVDKTLGVMLMIMQMNPTVAYKINKHHAVGGSLVIGVQSFRAYGLDYFSNFTQTFVDSGGTQDPAGLTNNGNDFSQGAGMRLGWLGTFFDKKLTVGVAGTTKVYMSKFNHYRDLFAENGDFDTPANFGVGFSYKPIDALTVALDVTETLYEGVKAVSNRGAQPNAGGAPYFVDEETNALGKDEGMGFGWENQTVYKLGLAWKADDQWTLRGGWNYGKSPIPEETGAVLFNILAPAVVQHHITMGASYQAARNHEINIGYVHGFEFKQNGPTYLGEVGQIGMSIDTVSMGYSFKF